MALTSTPWWDPKLCGPGSTSPPHVRLIPLVQQIQRAQQQRYDNMRKMIAVYEYGFGASATTSNDLNPIEDAKLHFNPAKNAIDTMHAQVCTPKISPMLLTEGGTRAQRMRAKMATKAVEGILDEGNFEEIQEDVVLDGMLAYCGFVNVFSRMRGPKTDRYAELCVERIIPEDVFVDDSEGRDRQPRCMYRRRFMDRYVALAEFGKPDKDLYGAASERRRAIKAAKSGKPAISDWTQETDQIEVWESWHLPSGVDCDDSETDHDGLHVIAIEGCTFLVESWDRDTFPIQEYRPEKARYGYWGLAVMQQAMAGQREYERVTEKLQRAHKLMGSSGFVEYGGGGEINTTEIGNGIAQIVKVTGSPGTLQEFTPAPANPQTYQYREGIASDILRFMGVSEMSAQSEIPSGMSQASGKALNTLSDTESKRGIIRHRTRERLVTGVTRLILDEARSLLKRGIRIESRFIDKRGFEPIDWKEIVDVLEDKRAYVVRIFPVGMLAKTPGLLFAQLDVLLERGVITIEQYKRLANMPDIEAENDIDCADTEIIDKNLDYMVTTGKYLAPQPFDALETIKVRGGKYYNAMRIAEVSDSRLELIRRYILDASALLTPTTPAVEPGMPPAPMPPSPEMMGGAPPMGAPPGMPPMMPPGMAA